MAILNLSRKERGGKGGKGERNPAVPCSTLKEGPKKKGSRKSWAIPPVLVSITLLKEGGEGGGSTSQRCVYALDQVGFLLSVMEGRRERGHALVGGDCERGHSDERTFDCAETERREGKGEGGVAGGRDTGQGKKRRVGEKALRTYFRRKREERGKKRIGAFELSHKRLRGKDAASRPSLVAAGKKRGREGGE